MNRLTDNDKNWGPFTFCKWKHRFGFHLNSGDGDDEDGYKNHILATAFGYGIRIQIPNIIRPWRIKHDAQWDEKTIARLGRNWYYQTWRREFGLSLSDMGNGYDFLQVHFGAQTHDSETTKSWCKHIPWKQWRCVRNSIYKPNGEHFATEIRGKFFDFMKIKDECPSASFEFEDFDGQKITATCIIEEREWHKGEGWFKWLKYFSTPKIRRSLDIKFSDEVGPEKGSWKGGTLGHGTEMEPNETPMEAFKKYCAKEHKQRGRSFSLRFIGTTEPAAVKA